MTQTARAALDLGCLEDGSGLVMGAHLMPYVRVVGVACAVDDHAEPF